MKRKLPAVLLAALFAFNCVGAFASDDDFTSKFYKDVNENSYGWAAKYIDDISNRNIVVGTGNRNFNPGADTKRGDFFLFLDNTFKLKQGNYSIFSISDVKESDYYFKAVVDAKVNGIIDFSGPVYPKDAITRADAMLYIYRALDLNGLAETNRSISLSQYSDADQIKKDEVKIAAATLSNMGIISGDNGRLKPNDPLSRAEMSVIFSKVCEALDDYAEEKALKEKEEKTKETVVDDTEEKDERYDNKELYEGVEIDSDEITAKGLKITASSEPALILRNQSNGKLSGSSLSSSASNTVVVDDTSVLDLIDCAVTGVAGTVVVDGSSEVNIQGGDYSANSGAIFDVIDGTLKISGDANIKVGNADNAIKLAQNAKVALSGNTSLTTKSKKGLIRFENSSVEKDSKNNSEKANKNASNYASFKMTGGSIKAENKDYPVFYLKDANAKATLTDVEIDSKNLIYAPIDKALRQDVGSNFELNIENSDIKGEIIVDDRTNVSLYLGDNAKFKGSVNTSKESPYCDIQIDDDAKVTFTGESRFRKFVIDDQGNFDFPNISTEGCVIYYDADDDANDYLSEEVYPLNGGGELRPY